jgi:hypothetical protein
MALITRCGVFYWDYTMNDTKRCNKCQQELPATLDFFHKNSKSPDGLRYTCKSCRRNEKTYPQSQRKHYLKNKQKIKERSAKWVENNKERAKQNKKQWYEKNKVVLNKKAVENRHKKRQSDPIQRVKESLSANLRNALNGHGKGQKTLDYLCMSIDEFKIYIESMFKDGMNWENYGLHGWHLDHIQPIHSFDHSDEEQVKQCWHYSNFQPLWAKDNLSKGCKPFTHNI